MLNLLNFRYPTRPILPFEVSARALSGRLVRTCFGNLRGQIRVKSTITSFRSPPWCHRTVPDRLDICTTAETENFNPKTCFAKLITLRTLSAFQMHNSPCFGARIQGQNPSSRKSGIRDLDKVFTHAATGAEFDLKKSARAYRFPKTPEIAALAKPENRTGSPCQTWPRKCLQTSKTTKTGA